MADGSPPNPVRKAARIDVVQGDSRDVLARLADGCMDAVVTDPPYALVSIRQRLGSPGAAPIQSNGASGVYARAGAGFMGQTWDTGETAFDPAFWAEVMRVLKPGGHLVAASGTRTYHRLACAIEDAGFEIRDMVSWLYGSGFPKSHDVSKGIDKALGAERTKVRIDASQIRNSKATGGGKDGTKGATRPWIEKAMADGFHEAVSPEAVSPEAVSRKGWGTALKPACEPWVLARKPLDGTVAANVLAHGTGALNIDGCRVAAADGYTENAVTQGLNTARTSYEHRRERRTFEPAPAGRWPANVVHDGSDEVVSGFPSEAGGGKPGKPGKPTVHAYGEGLGTSAVGHNDSGSAARFFYSAKADAEDRLGADHPTVKPVDLMRWLVRLVTPPGGRVLDPFAGSGSTGVACLGEGFDALLIEREANYVATIRRRLAWARGEGALTDIEMARLDSPAKRLKAAGADTPLFGEWEG